MNRRYEKQIILPEVGEAGQERLMHAKVVVVGAGGLGSPALYYLAAAGVGTIRIIDCDIVDVTNLNRQFIHFENDIGREKQQSAKEKLLGFNKNIHIDAVCARLDKNNASELLTGFDIVVSCVDNNETRYILNSVCVKSKTPLINGGVEGFSGYVMVMKPGETPCFQCIFPENEECLFIGARNKPEEGCGILGASAGVAGSLMAAETIKVLLEMQINPYLYYIDLISTQLVPIDAIKMENCPACGKHKELR